MILWDRLSARCPHAGPFIFPPENPLRFPWHILKFLGRDLIWYGKIHTTYHYVDSDTRMLLAWWHPWILEQPVKLFQNIPDTSRDELMTSWHRYILLSTKLCVYQTSLAWSMNQGSNKYHSPVNNFAPTVTKFCVLWEDVSLPHDTKFGNCRGRIVDSRMFSSWSLVHGLSWSGLIKAEPGWPFLRGLHLSPVVSCHGTSWGGALVIIFVSPNYQLNKQSKCR